MRTLLIAILLVLPLQAQKDVSASDAWVAESAADGTAPVYLTIQNPTMYDVFVTSATSDAAGKIELRDKDKTVANLTVPAYGSLELKPGGAYLRLVDLKKPLQSGATVSLSFETDGGVTVKVSATVKGV